MIRIHPIQTGLVKVPRCQIEGASGNIARLFQIFFRKLWSDWLPVYCFLIEHPEGLFLIDAGEISQVNEPGFLPDSLVFRSTVQYQISREEEVDRSIEALGFRVEDVKRVFLTHLHTDHMDGVVHFPHAEMLVPETAWLAMQEKNAAGIGYLKSHLPEWFEPITFNFDDGPEENFAQSKHLTADGSLIAVPLPGHAPGQTGYILKFEGQIVFFTADVTYNLETLKAGIPFVVLDSPESRSTVAAVSEYAIRTGATVISFHNKDVPSLLKRT